MRLSPSPCPHLLLQDLGGLRPARWVGQGKALGPVGQAFGLLLAEAPFSHSSAPCPQELLLAPALLSPTGTSLSLSCPCPSVSFRFGVESNMGFTSRPQAAVGQLLGMSLHITLQGPHHSSWTWRGRGRNRVWVLLASPFCSLLTPHPQPPVPNTWFLTELLWKPSWS